MKGQEFVLVPCKVKKSQQGQIVPAKSRCSSKFKEFWEGQEVHTKSGSPTKFKTFWPGQEVPTEATDIVGVSSVSSKESKEDIYTS